MAIHHEEQQRRNMQHQMAQPMQAKQENQVRRLQGVQDQTEMQQAVINDEMMIEDYQPLQLQNTDILHVKVVQQQNIAHVTEHAIEAPINEEYAASLNTLTYHDFTKMIGTYNRGQVELSDGQLKIINNHKFSRSKGKMSVNNRALRERFLALAIEKMGGQMPTELYEHIRKTLKLDQEGENSLPLTRQQIHDVLADVNMHTSTVSKVLASDQGMEDPQYRLAKAANDLLCGDLSAYERSHTTLQTEKKLRETVKAIIKKAKESGKTKLSLSEHQLDNLIKGNLELVRDDIYQALQQTYQGMVNGNDEQPLDEGAMKHLLDHIGEIAAFAIMKRAAASEAGVQLAEFEWKNYRADLADQWEEKQQSGRKSYFTEMENLKVVSAGADVAFEDARTENATALMELQANERKRAEIGITDLETLFSNLGKITCYWDRAEGNGLTPDEAAEMRTAVETINALMNKEKNEGPNMEVAANVLKGTRFEVDFMSFKEKMDHDEQYLEHVVEKFLDMTEHKEQPQVAAGQQESYQFSMLSPKAKQIASIFFAKNSPLDYLKENDEKMASDYLQLYKKIKALVGAYIDQSQMTNDIVTIANGTIDGVDFSIEQKTEGLLELIIDGNRLTLPVNASFLAEKMETDIVQNEKLYGTEAVKEVISNFQGITYAQSEWTHVRTVCLHFLQEKTQLPSDYFNNTPTNLVRRYAGYLLSGDMTRENIIKLVSFSDKIENGALINGAETMELLAMAEQRAQEEQQRLQDLQELQEQEEYAEILQTVIRHEQQNVEEEEDGWTHEESQVKDFVADLIFASDTWTTDRLVEKPGAYLATVLDRHASDILLLIRQPQLLTDMLDKLMLDEGIKQQARDNLEQITGNPAFQMITELVPDEMALGIIHQLIRSDVFKEDMEKMELNMLLEIRNQVDEIQKTIADSADEIFGGPQQANQENQQAAQAEQQRNQALEQALANNKKLKKQYEFNKSVDKLNDMMKESVSGERGQGKFMKLVLKQYFSNVSELDQRAMVASAIRNAKPMPQIPDNANKEERDRIERRIQGNYLGGFLKGAGPLLQKMLQGIPMEGLPDELKDAFKDMKSKLAPIPAEIVEAQMNAMVERSHGQVTQIEITRALGAASVGQAFLCKLYGPNLPQDGKDVVVKLLRPDVRNRMMREKQIMLDCAERTDTNHGMYDTYVGQLSRIEEELDLTLEAKNVKDGKVYDESFEKVKSMKLNTLIEPTNNSMVLERAPGTTVDKYLEEVKETKQMLEQFYLRDDDGKTMMCNGNLKGGIRVPILELNDGNRISYLKLRRRLAQQLEQLRKRQAYLVQLSQTWVSEGIYGKGFYHGDLHAGNIMINDDGLTVIDFGNATKLTSDQQTEVTRMVAAAAFGEVKQFIDGLHNLLEYKDEKEREKKEVYFQEKRKDLQKEFETIFSLGNHQQAGQRIAVALLKAQELGIQVPPAIFNFSQCQIRLQNALEEVNGLLKTLQDGMVSAMSMDLHYAAIATLSLDALPSSAGGDANAIEDAMHTYGFSSEEAVFAELDEQIEQNKTLDDIYANYERSCYLGLDHSLEEIKTSFLRAKNGEMEEEDIIHCILSLSPFCNLSPLNRNLTKLKNQYLNCLKDPKNNEEKFKEFLETLEKYTEPGREARQRFRQALQEYHTAAGEHVSDDRKNQLKKEVYETLCELEFVDLFYMNGTCVHIENQLKNVEPAQVQRMTQQFQPLFEDENYGGQQLREAYEAFRAAQQAYIAFPENQQKNAADDQKLALKRQYDQTERAFLRLFQQSVIKQIEEIKNVHDMKFKWQEPETFFGVMADVITSNLTTSLSRLGKVATLKYSGKVKNLNDSMQYQNIDDQLRQATAAVNNANQGGAQA